jgi:hypothetical protein
MAVVPAIMLLPEDPEDISAAAEGLIARNLRYLRRFPTTPSVYQLGAVGRLRYRFEQPGAHWWTIPEMLRAGWGDCKDLSCAVIARERIAGGETVNAAGVRWPRMIVVPTGPRTLHAIVEHACGCREDPSIALGMPTPPGGAPWLMT